MAGKARTRADRLLEHLIETVSVLAPDGTLLFSTDDGRGVLGYDADTFVGGALLDGDLIHPDDLSFVLESMAEVLRRPGTSVSGEFRVRHADGAWQTLEATAHNLTDDPLVGGVVLTTRNVTERVRAQEALAASQDRFGALLQHATDLVLVLQVGARVAFATPASLSLLGRSPAELYELDGLDDLIHPDDRAVLAAAAQQAQTTGQSVAVQFRVLHADGHARTLAATLSDLTALPAVGGLVVNAHDVTERARFEEALSHQATHDPLTGLPNRALLLDRLEQSLARARRGGGMVTVLFCDLDRLKVVNDSVGHHAGDEVLREAATRLAHTLRPTDTVARLGGDEFVIVCEGLVSAEERSALARRLLATLGRPMEAGGNQLVVTASIGIAAASADNTAADELIRDADAAMYLAKTGGRNRFAHFDEALRTRSVHRMATEVALRRALQHHEFALVHQPIFTLDGRIVGVEALVRWRDPERGTVAPGEFLPVAEETGLMVPIGQWVLGTALADARRWHARGVRTWVNLSARELAEPGLPERLAAMAAGVGMPAAALGVEVTESALVSDAATAADTLLALQHVGVAVALDDFGTGYSSLTHLKSFPVDVLKIDRSFVQALALGSDDNSIVGAIVAMAHALGLTVVAEGVETRAQLDQLRALAVDHVQGFLLGRPAPADDVLAAQTAR